MAEENIKHFFGVYLLYCTNPKYKGRTYIGYTVNPIRRTKQHNIGQKAGGAYRTSNKGPWEMVLIIHGFPNDISALRFEWAWQHPGRSRRLKHVPKKPYKEKVFVYLIRVLSEMLRVGPWNRLPLTIRWLKQEYMLEFPIDRSPPIHMPIAYGPVTVAKKDSKSQIPIEDEDEIFIDTCYVCDLPVFAKQKLLCVNPECTLASHIICLAKTFNKTSNIIPVGGKCPKCQLEVLWGDLIRRKKGCFDIPSSSQDFEGT